MPKLLRTPARKYFTSLCIPLSKIPIKTENPSKGTMAVFHRWMEAGKREEIKC